VEEMVAKAKYFKGCHIFGRNNYATESERLKTHEKRGDYRKIYCFGLSLRYKKGVQFCSRNNVYERGTILANISILKGKGLNLRVGPPRTKLY